MRNVEYNRKEKNFEVAEYSIGKKMEDIRIVLTTGATKTEAIENLKKITGRK